MRKLFIILAIAAILFIGLLAATVSIALLSGSQNFNFSKKIAIIPLKGEISMESETFSQNLTALEVVEKLNEAETDPQIGAILLDIDSPGGGIVSSRQIVEKLRNAKKPTVSWIGETGASGAYYAAAATNFIIADKDSITGSIGVISVFPNIEELLGKIGVKMQVLKEGKFKDIGSPFGELTPEEKNLLQELLKEAFQRFKKDIISFRGEKLNAMEFDKISDGRILSGEQAYKIGLIDGFGTREEAIKKAAELGGITGEKPETKDFGKKESTLLETLAKTGYSFGQGIKAGITSENSKKIITT